MPLSGEREREQTYIIQQCSKSYEHRESVASQMTIDYSGNWVLLAGRRHLALQRLGQEEATLKTFPRNSKYEVSAAEFAICPNRKEFCAIATSQDIDIVTLAAEPRSFHTLRGHFRTITDIDWHNKEPNLLASCSIDTFSHVWDLRDPKKPKLSFSAVCMSGATQVGFNRVSGNLLAAAHDGDLRIWDIRKGSCPIHYITAHLNRVHGINWSHRLESCLATASQDGTVKYFNINNPRQAEKIITTSSPVWRARYTPIGNGLVSIVVPHLGRGENSLLLWSNSKQTDAICSFVGHTDVILDFAWRPNRENPTEIEFLTWSRDRTLRVWKIDETMLKLCEPPPDSEGYESNNNDTRDVETPTLSTSANLQHLKSGYNHHYPATSLPTEAIDALQLSRSPPPPYRRDEQVVARSLTDKPTCSLHHEFSLLNRNIPDVEVEVLDAIQRFAIFKISAGGHVAVLQATFPTEYPSPNIAPSFNFCQETTLSDHLQVLLLKVLKRNALQCVKRSRQCLEYCLRALVTAIEKSVGGSDKSQLRLQSPRLEGALSALHDACIPFPRTSAVSFNAIGHFTVFAQVINTKRLSLRHQNTPRTLSSNGGLLGNVMGHRDSNASFYLQDRMSSKHSKNRILQKSANGTPVVHVYDASKVLNLSRSMANEFSLDKRDIIQTCRKNRQICEANGRLELMPIWTLAEMIATPNIPNETKYEALFYKNPFKKFLLEALITHYGNVGDLHTAVMLACLFHKCPPIGDPLDSNGKVPKLPSNLSPYHTVLPIDYQASPDLKLYNSIDTMPSQQIYSNSWSEVLDWMDANSNRVNDALSYTCSLIPIDKMPLFDHYKRIYAEILYGWQLLSKRALILKHTQYGDVVPLNYMHRIRPRTKRLSALDFRHKVTSLNICCDLCLLPVRGVASVCLACDHGGHAIHMRQWFEKHDICAAGCGCHCLKQTRSMLEHIN